MWCLNEEELATEFTEDTESVLAADDSMSQD